ncbi:MAG: tetratricopeptide repeat protein [Nitrospirae bacterium]|nr:tetratricopeptide repeat protein [Nitrospirota bacterium]
MIETEAASGNSEETKRKPPIATIFIIVAIAAIGIYGYFSFTDSNKSGQLLVKGYEALKADNYKDGTEMLTKALEADPQNADAYMLRAIAYGKQGAHKEAIADLDKAISINPRLTEAYVNRGIAYAALSKHTDAIADLDKALQLDPKHRYAYIARARSLMTSGNMAKAIEDYSKAVELDPNDPSPFYNIACVYSINKDTSKACEYLKKSIDRGMSSFSAMKQDKDLDNIRNSSCYKKIMEGK